MSILSYLHFIQEMNPLAVKWINIITGISRILYLIHKHQLAVAEWWLISAPRYSGKSLKMRWKECIFILCSLLHTLIARDVVVKLGAVTWIDTGHCSDLASWLKKSVYSWDRISIFDNEGSQEAVFSAPSWFLLPWVQYVWSGYDTGPALVCNTEEYNITLSCSYHGKGCVLQLVFAQVTQIRSRSDPDSDQDIWFIVCACSSLRVSLKYFGKAQLTSQCV